ncbi:hypothetical protein [Nonlabens agnitus]|uniref:hypothetical protein n=1 Tax=Nonlabens agnitus TaxID=870484 RepID=UPI0015599229|nr:hypothetical protein [Nonlabens agnitus]
MARAYRTRLTATGTTPDGDDVSDLSDDKATWRMIQRIRTFGMTVNILLLKESTFTMRTVTASHSWARRSATASL